MQDLFDALKDATHICVIAHRNPDLDSLGSASALYSHIMQLHKKASFVCVSEMLPANASFVPWFDKIRTTIHSSVDLIITLDCGSYSRVGFEFSCKSVNIDHHRSNEKYADINIVDSEAISTTEVVYNLFKEQGVKINVKMATALYAGLLDDSRRYLYLGKDAKALQLGSELAQLGADTSTCNNALYQEKSLASLRIKSLMLGAFELFHEAEIAFVYVSEEMFNQSGASAYDCEEPLEEILSLARVKVALLLRYKREGGFKGSLRSKGNIDIGKIASLYGGGGHLNSAGFELSNTISLDIKSEIIELITKELNA